MLSKPEAKQSILRIITENIPKGIWDDVQAATAAAYRDAWTSTRDDPRFAHTPGQRRFRAPQERHFLMESGLAEVAVRNKVSFASEVVKANTWVYGMLRTPGICVMQKKVGQGLEPPPAKFRRQIAATNSFVRQGNIFALGDEHIVSCKPIFGFLIHAPESQRFAHDGYGRPAFVRLAFAYNDYSGWAAKFEVSELAAAYAPDPGAEVTKRVRPTPTWKTTGDKTTMDGTDGI